MAQISDARKAVESQAFSEIWKFRREVAEVEARNEYWEDVIKRSNELLAKYKDNYFLHRIIIDNLDDLEIRYHGHDQHKASLRAFNTMREKQGLPPVMEVLNG